MDNQSCSFSNTNFLRNSFDTVGVYLPSQRKELFFALISPYLFKSNFRLKLVKNRAIGIPTSNNSSKMNKMKTSRKRMNKEHKNSHLCVTLTTDDLI